MVKCLKGRINNYHLILKGIRYLRDGTLTNFVKLT